MSQKPKNVIYFSRDLYILCIILIREVFHLLIKRILQTKKNGNSMNYSNWFPVRRCLLFTITLYFLGLSPIFGECQLNCISSVDISLDQTGNALLSPNLFLIDADNCTGQKEILIMNKLLV